MKKILTALQNEKIHEKLKEFSQIKVIKNDILYKEGIIEILQENSNVDYIIINELLPGEIDLKELLKKIKEINNKINCIIILENRNEELENYLLAKGKTKIIYNNEITIEDLINMIKQESEQELIKNELNELKQMIENNKEENKTNFINHTNSEEFITKDEISEIEKEIEEEYENKLISKKFIHIFKRKCEKIKNKTILILGERGIGKTVFTINLANNFSKSKILIIENSEIESEINILLKKNKKIDILSINKIERDEINFFKKINQLKKEYEIIIIDNQQIENQYFKNLITISDKYILLIEPNILQVKKAKEYLKKIQKNYKLNKEKINIVFNKVMKDSISFSILKNMYKNYQLIGKINLISNCNTMINHNMKLLFLNKEIKKQYKKVIREIIKNNNLEKYYQKKINQ